MTRTPRVVVLIGGSLVAFALLAGGASSRGLADTTPPVTTASFSPALNGSGWATQNVAVTLTATDNVAVQSITYSASGAQTIATTTVSGSTAHFTISAAGTTTITFHATDTSSNNETPKTATVKIDRTAPTLTGSQTPAANASGWNNANVTVSWVCSDVGSGIAKCPGNTVVSAEGAGQKVTGTATDVAGNATTQTVTINLDKTGPTISGLASPAANGNGWNNTNVTVTFTCADSLSGIASCTSPVTVGAEGGGQSVTGTALDKAGNSATTTVKISIDKTPPLVAFTPHLGHPTVDRTLNITCVATDPVSGVASTNCTHRVVPAWTLPLGLTTFTGTATDKAGNVASGKTGVTVQVTFASLKKLTSHLSSKKTVAEELNALLRNAQASRAKRSSFLVSYRKRVAAEKGKAFTGKEAAALIRFSRAL